ncbi:pilus assembly protein [Thermodesulfobacteriota bacterium]
MEITGGTGTGFELKKPSDGVGVGTAYYSDLGSPTFIAPFPEAFTNYVLIATDAGDNDNTDSNYLTFTVSGDADVYIGFDSRSKYLPCWFTTEGFTDMGIVIATSDPDSDFKIYKKTGATEEVTLGGNATCDPPPVSACNEGCEKSGDPALNNYIVFIDEEFYLNPGTLDLRPPDRYISVDGNVDGNGTATVVGGTGTITLQDETPYDWDSEFFKVQFGDKISEDPDVYSYTGVTGSVVDVTVMKPGSATATLTFTDEYGKKAELNLNASTLFEVWLDPYTTADNDYNPITNGETEVLYLKPNEPEAIHVTGGLGVGNYTAQSEHLEYVNFLEDDDGAVTDVVTFITKTDEETGEEYHYFWIKAFDNPGETSVVSTITIGDGDSVAYVTATVLAPLVLDPSTVYLTSDVLETTVTIKGGLGDVVIDGAYPENIATLQITGRTITVKAVSAGQYTVWLKDENNDPVMLTVDVGAGINTGLGSCPSPPFIVGESISPNILFIIDHSDSMNATGTGFDIKKFDVVRQTLIGNPDDELDVGVIGENPSIRFGLMRMDGSNGSGQPWPDTYDGDPVVKHGGKLLKECGTNHGELIEYLAGWTIGNAPEDQEGGEDNGAYSVLAETLASAAQYFATVQIDDPDDETGTQKIRVAKIKWHDVWDETKDGHDLYIPPYERPYDYWYDKGDGKGLSRHTGTNTDDLGNWHAALSPIENWCQNSFIVVITDSSPDFDNDWSVVSDLIVNDERIAGFDGNITGNNTYADDVAAFLNIGDADVRSDLEGEQKLPVYVITTSHEQQADLTRSAATIGDGKFFLASNQAELRDAIRDTIEDIKKRIASGTAVATISGSTQGEERLLRARFLSVVWKGYLDSFTLPYTGGAPVWEAGEILKARIASSTHSDRKIYTYFGDPKAKTAFDTSNSGLVEELCSIWDVGADPTINCTVSGSDEVKETEAMINYLRGDTTYETFDKGELYRFRDREEWPLGDIIYSTPVIVGPPKMPYIPRQGRPAEYADYQSFKESVSRTKMVYVGANDGMLHAFRLDNGAEEWAFIPQYSREKMDALTRAENCHDYYVDLPPVSADVYGSWPSVGDAWKTVLVGGNRLGGEEYFCLDITNPTPDGFGTLWDVIPFPGMLSVTKPNIEKVKANSGAIDNWAAIVTSGYTEDNVKQGGIKALDITDGSALAIWKDDAGYVDELKTGQITGDNPYYAMTTPNGYDIDNDGRLDLIYAGDTEGTLWKFYYDHTADAWKKMALFQTQLIDDGVRQPITTRPDLILSKKEVVTIDGDTRRGVLRIVFGTGQYYINDDRVGTAMNSVYCIVDPIRSSGYYYGDLTASTYSEANYPYPSAYPFGPVAFGPVAEMADLTTAVNQTLYDDLEDAVKAKVLNVGWYIDLKVNDPSPSEKMVEPAVTVAGSIFFTTFQPHQDICGYGGDSLLYALDLKNALPATADPNDTGNLVAVLEELNDPDTYKTGDTWTHPRYVSLNKNEGEGGGYASAPVFHSTFGGDQFVFVQTGDGNIKPGKVNLKSQPMTIKFWWSN